MTPIIDDFMSHPYVCSISRRRIGIAFQFEQFVTQYTRLPEFWRTILAYRNLTLV
jgi:hypothetical protein